MNKRALATGTIIYLIFGSIAVGAVLWTDAKGWVISSLYTSEGKMGAQAGAIHHK